MLRNTPKKIEECLIGLLHGESLINQNQGFLRDLAILGIITYKNRKFSYSDIWNEFNSENVKELLSKQANQIPKISKTLEYYLNAKVIRVTAKDVIINVPEVLDDDLKDSSKLIYAGYLLNWAKYIDSTNKQSHK